MIRKLLPLATLSSLALAAIHEVSVGGLQADGKTANLNFTPNIVQATIGDQVKFTFHVKNHTVTQSSFQSPCSKLLSAYNQPTGFDSGFVPVDASLTSNFPTYTITINDSQPIWGYCQQGSPPSTHCQAGMVFAINPPASGSTFDKFLSTARYSTTQNSQLSSTSTSTPASSASSTPVVHEVIVGGLQADAKTPNLNFLPNNIKAAVGDKVRFTFNVKNHTVTQSSFNSPCSKLINASGQQNGFDSGFRPVNASLTANFPTFEVTVNDTAPIWGYCQQGAPPMTHCQSGMVFGINAPEYGNTFDQFLTRAKGSTEQNLPPTSTYSASYATNTPVVHEITVGGLQADGKTPNLNFSPNNIKAAVGDKVRFTFNVKNHTVTQSSFNSPCSKLLNSYGQPSGFDSGFRPVDASLTSNFPTFELTVNDTAPIWGYCQQVNPPSTHCQSGMVFGINAPDYGNTFDQFLARAKSSVAQGSIPPATTAAYGGSKAAGALEGDGNTESDSDNLHKLLSYVPAVLGLLGAAVLLLIILIGVTIAILIRRRKGDAPARSVAVNYKPVPLMTPHSKMQDDGSHDYDMPRYSDGV